MKILTRREAAGVCLDDIMPGLVEYPPIIANLMN